MRSEVWKLICAVLLIMSSIALAFIQALTLGDIANGVLIYIAQAFMLAGALFGLDYYLDKLHNAVWINKIIVHCSDSPYMRDDSAADIDAWHRQRGFRKIGYHYVIRLDGRIEKGREEWEVGAHCKTQNLHSIGVCYIGGRDPNGKIADTRTKAQKESLYALLSSLVEKYHCPIFWAP